VRFLRIEAKILSGISVPRAEAACSFRGS